MGSAVSLSKLRNGLKERGLFLLLFKQLGNGVRTGSGTSGSARDVSFAALRTDCGMQRHRLADNLTVFPSGLCLLTHNMLLLMSPHDGGGLFGGDSGGSFEGNAGIVGAVLIFPLFCTLRTTTNCSTASSRSPPAYRPAKRRPPHIECGPSRPWP